MAHTKRKTVGLVLGNGGVRGVAHVGVIKELVQAGIPIDYVVGCSIGALVGAKFCLDQDIEALEHTVFGEKTKAALAFVEPGWKGGMVKGKKFETLLKSWFGDITFEDLALPLSVVTTDLLGGSEEIYSTGKLIPPVRASMSIPFVFNAVKYDEKILVDGGVVNPLPSNVARAMGADIVIAVNPDNELAGQNLTERDVRFGYQVTKQSYNLMRYYLTKLHSADADITINPHFMQRGVVNWSEYFFKKNKEQEFIELGRQAAQPHISKIKKLLTLREE